MNMPREVKLSLLTLVSKGDAPSTFNDYRPIAISSFIYRFIAKLLANRINKVMHKLVGVSQTAFMEGRHIEDNVLLCQELLYGYHSSKGMPRFSAKIDLQKAYDSVQWSFLVTLLLWLNFPPIFITWVSNCIINPSYVVSLNGAQSPLFSTNRGLRQGCPMSPFLFNIVLQVFTDSLFVAAKAGTFQYHQFCAKPELTSVCFADDLFIFGKATTSNAITLKKLLDEFSGLFGLSINHGKSSLFFANCDAGIKGWFECTLNMSEGHLPIKYLGVPLATQGPRACDFQLLISKVEHKISSWSARMLSFAGRLTLLKSIVMGCISNWVDTRWLGRLFVGQKRRGGLGLRRLRDWNTTALMRHVWSLSSKQESCWSLFVLHRWLKRHSVWSLTLPSQCSISFREILKTRHLAACCTRTLIHFGEGTLSWFDPWLANGPIAQPGILIADSLSRGVFDCVSHILADDQKWVNQTQDVALNDRWEEIQSTKVHKKLRGDLVVWTPTSSGMFSLKSAWNVVHSGSERKELCDLIWYSHSQPRFSFVYWVALWGRLPVRWLLAGWGIGIHFSCFLCGVVVETIDHLLIECPFSSVVWKDVLILNGFNRQPVGSWNDEVQWLVTHFDGRSLPDSVQKFSFNSSVYRIWQERNDRAHQRRPSSTTTVLNRIISDVRGRFSSLVLKMEDTSRQRDFFARWGIPVVFTLPFATQHTWPAPPVGWVAINCDGSVKDASGGFGAIGRNHLGQPVFALAGGLQGTSVICLELEAI
ncbi:uncharacterized protein LOC122645066 [Telopea speciosissima]|uniref:uncharacterized protein LOC122645066 n=1 Tax=Telopea speciosissima TaxID=54955 RepID=UPI001CC618D3|nr:uncharacterized protein LOC122645066 [Telopea speciosissima]